MRTSWKMVIEERRERLERGEEVVVQTPAPSEHNALRAAALKAGYSARMRGGETILSKSSTMRRALTEHVVVSERVQLRMQPEWTPLWPWPTDLEGHAKKFAAHAYGHYVRYNKGGASYRPINLVTDKFDCVHTQMSNTIWWVIATQDLTYEQPTQPTLDRLLSEIYSKDAFDQPSSLIAIANACARIKYEFSWNMFDNTSVEIPLMTPEEALHNVEEVFKRDEIRSAPFRERALDRRREEEANRIYDIND